MKFRNQTQPAADSFNHRPSSLAPLYSITAFVANNETWELPITFSIDYTYIENRDDVNLSKIIFNYIVFNGATFDLEGISAYWDPELRGFFGYLFFELWIYNDSTNAFEYHERFTSLRFSMRV